MGGDDRNSIMADSYQSADSAESYHRLISYSDLSVRSLAGYISTVTERRTIKQLLSHTPHEKVIDIPAGTGKLAPVFADEGVDVLSVDISAEMLKVARQEYNKEGHEDVKFVVADAENVSNTIDELFDVTICLRLLHRVPSDVQQQVLLELSNLSKYSIVTFGCNSTGRPGYDRIRKLSKKLVGARTNNPHIQPVEECIKKIEEAGFEVLDYKRTFLLSDQVAFLLKSTNSN